jgi:hypothetical protein
MDMKANAQDSLSVTTQNVTSNQAMSGLELKLHQCQVPVELAIGSDVDPEHASLLPENCVSESESSMTTHQHVMASMLAQHEAQQKKIMRLASELKRIASNAT